MEILSYCYELFSSFQEENEKGVSKGKSESEKGKKSDKKYVTCDIIIYYYYYYYY